MPRINNADSVFRKKGTDKGLYASADDTKKERVLKFLGRNGPLLGAFLVALLVWFTVGGIGDSRESTLAGQRGEIASLRQQLSMQQDKTDEKLGEAVSDATGGMDIEHKRTDDEAMTGLLEQALTWNGLAEYMKTREAIIAKYGFAQDSAFMSVFMPGEEQGVTRTAPSGKTYSAFDEDMKSQFVSLTSYVTRVDSDVYSYFALAEMRVASSSGAATTTGYVAMSYQMIDGQPTNLDAWTVPGGVDRSG